MGEKKVSGDEPSKLGMKYYQVAAKLGNSDAQCYLADCYSAGRGITQDDVMAAKYYRLSAEQGNINAQYSFGCCCEKGRGVPQDLAKALTFYKQAADIGSLEAKAALQRLKNAA